MIFNHQWGKWWCLLQSLKGYKQTDIRIVDRLRLCPLEACMWILNVVSVVVRGLLSPQAERAKTGPADARIA